MKTIFGQTVSTTKEVGLIHGCNALAFGNIFEI